MLILKNALLIDSISREPIAHSYVRIEGNRITEVGQNLTDNQTCETIDLEGRTLMPGLTDAHIHFGGPVSFTEPPLLGGEATGWFSSMRRCLLSHGVTNTRSGGDFETDMLQFREMLETGTLEGPRTWICGRAFQPVGGHPAYTVWQSSGDILAHAVISPKATPEAAAEVRRQVSAGVNHIKCFLADDNYMNPGQKSPKLDLNTLRAVIEEAHKHGLKTMVHCQEPAFALEALKAGADSVEHLICSGHEGDPLPYDLAEAFKTRNAFLVPTLVSAYYYGFSPDIQAKILGSVKALFDKGVKIAVGTDSGTPNVPPGEAVHKEMELLVQAGIPPMEAIIAATRHGAEIVSSDAFGAILPGKLADLIVVDGNPLEDITYTKNIRLVMKEGKITDTLCL